MPVKHIKYRVRERTLVARKGGGKAIFITSDLLERTIKLVDNIVED